MALTDLPQIVSQPRKHRQRPNKANHSTMPLQKAPSQPRLPWTGEPEPFSGASTKGHGHIWEEDNLEQECDLSRHNPAERPSSLSCIAEKESLKLDGVNTSSWTSFTFFSCKYRPFLHNCRKIPIFPFFVHVTLEMRTIQQCPSALWKRE